jgi:hypothetical protein
LAALVPTFVFATSTRGRFKEAFRSGWPIAAVLGTYFATHYWHFGELLPNTFYAKSFSEFSDADTTKLVLALSPLLVLALLPGRAVFVLAAIYSVALVVKYVDSTLAMNYADRFVFHVFAPLYLFAVYKLDRRALAAPNSPESGQSHNSHSRRALALTGWLFVSGAVTGFYYDTFSYFRFANYTPRLHSVHGEFGRVLQELAQRGEVGAYAMGDAGIAAYHSGLPALDLLGLGSRTLTRTGITEQLIKEYQPDIIVIYANREGVLDRPAWHDALLDYARAEEFSGSCRLFVDNYERLVVHSRVPHPEIESLCAVTQEINNVPTSQYLLRHINRPPWDFWHD